MPVNTRRNSYNNKRVYIAIDTESTGVEADTGEIIEIAVLRFRLEKAGQVRVLEEWQTFVRPQNPIPYKITNLTGIRQADVENAPSFNQIRERLRQFLGNYPIVAHSVESDNGLDFLVEEEKIAAIKVHPIEPTIFTRLQNMMVAAVETARREAKCVVVSVINDTKREKLVKEIIPELQERLGRLEEPTDKNNKKITHA